MSWTEALVINSNPKKPLDQLFLDKKVIPSDDFLERIIFDGLTQEDAPILATFSSLVSGNVRIKIKCSEDESEKVNWTIWDLSEEDSHTSVLTFEVVFGEEVVIDFPVTKGKKYGFTSTGGTYYVEYVDITGTLVQNVFTTEQFI